MMSLGWVPRYNKFSSVLGYKTPLYTSSDKMTESCCDVSAIEGNVSTVYQHGVCAIITLNLRSMIFI